MYTCAVQLGERRSASLHIYIYAYIYMYTCAVQVGENERQFVQALKEQRAKFTRQLTEMTHERDEAMREMAMVQAKLAVAERQKEVHHNTY